MKFNFNNHVRVQLTDDGRRIYAQYEQAQRARMAYYGLVYYEEPHPEDDSGWTKWQLWNLMEIFGPHISVGGPMMFAAEIEFNEKDMT